MFDALLRKARDLKRRSRTQRDEGDKQNDKGLYREAIHSYQSAETLLREAIDLLTSTVASAGEKLPEGVPASLDVQETATELADCWGSLGGVRRRHAEALRRNQQAGEADAQYRAAIDAYERGLALEADDRFRIANSYNLVQRVVVPVLTSPESLSNSQLQERLRNIWLSIERQIDTTRPGDAWAYSDLGLVQLLAGDEATANRSWDKMDDLHPQRKVYTSGLPVLEALGNVLPHLQPLRRAADRFREHVRGTD